MTSTQHELLLKELRDLQRRVSALQSMLIASDGKPVSAAPCAADAAPRVIALVAMRLKVKIPDIVGKRRQQDIVWARQLAMYLTRELTGESYALVGRAFGTDHSSVLYSCQTVRDRCQCYPGKEVLRKELATQLVEMALSERN